MNENLTSFLVATVGPTASGKSALGVWLAEQLDGEVVACDSTQLYRGFDIGTAKPRAAERRDVPHHLIDVLDPHEPATAGGYRQMALAVLQDLKHRKRLPILTVGTGLYLRALLEGLAEIPQRSEGLRARLRASSTNSERFSRPCSPAGMPGKRGARFQPTPTSRARSAVET